MVRKEKKAPAYVKISSTQTNDDFNEIEEINVPYNAIVSGDRLYDKSTASINLNSEKLKAFPLRSRRKESSLSSLLFNILL